MSRDIRACVIGNLDELRFEGGYPTAESIHKLYDRLDLQRAAQAYLDFIPRDVDAGLAGRAPRDWGASETGGMIVFVEPGTLFHYGAIVVTPAMEAKMVSVGSHTSAPSINPM